MDPKCRKGILLKTGVNEGEFWEPPNLPDRPLLYRLLTFSVKRSVACVAREIQSAALEIWRSHAIFQAPLPLEHWLMHRRNVCKFYILKVRFPFALCLFGCCCCCCCFLLFSVKRYGHRKGRLKACCVPMEWSGWGTDLKSLRSVQSNSAYTHE